MNTFQLRLFGFLKIPLLAWVKPTIIELNSNRCVLKIPLIRRTKNHLGSMYFGVLAVGADLAGGIIAFDRFQKDKKKVSLVFSKFEANFLKRATNDVFFIFEDGKKLNEFIDQVYQTKDRMNFDLNIEAQSNNEKIADFRLTLSLKQS